MNPNFFIRDYFATHNPNIRGGSPLYKYTSKSLIMNPTIFDQKITHFNKNTLQL